ADRARPGWRDGPCASRCCAPADRRLHRRCSRGTSATGRNRHAARGIGAVKHVTTSFWWVRHAAGRPGGRGCGQTCVPRDCSDTTAFTGLAEKLPQHGALWVTSNLRRTQETAAAIIRAGLPGPESILGPDAIAIPEFAEQDFGEWQGLTYEELEESRA